MKEPPGRELCVIHAPAGIREQASAMAAASVRPVSGHRRGLDPVRTNGLPSWCPYDHLGLKGYGRWRVWSPTSEWPCHRGHVSAQGLFDRALWPEPTVYFLACREAPDMLAVIRILLHTLETRNLADSTSAATASLSLS